MLEHLQEDPLGPLVVVGVSGVHAAIPVKAITQHLQLAGEVSDVILGDDSGVDMVLDGVVLRGQTERVKADGEQDVIALHSLFTGDNIHGRKGTGMTHVQTLTGGIGELDQTVELGALVAGDGGIGLGLFPIGLPFLFNGRKIVIHGCFSLYPNLLWQNIKSLTSEEVRDVKTCYHPDSAAGRPAGAQFPSFYNVKGASPVTGRGRSALFRRKAPGPVSRSATAGSLA